MLFVNVFVFCFVFIVSIYNNVELVNLFSNCKGFIDVIVLYEFFVVVE